MAGLYAPIAYDEMHAVMVEYGLSLIVLPGVKELVYGKLVGKGLCLRVYTSIVHGSSRDVGKDAIRVCLVMKIEDGSIVGVGASSRVYRLATWRANLVKRLEMWTRLLGPACSRCGAYTAQRSSQYGLFWGCIHYPQCKGTVAYSPLGKAVHMQGG